MIRAFKDIRYRFFKEKKVRNYLLYAFGEIFLIVVGILIALQISNWNDKKKLTQQGEEMISEIKRGISSDLNQLDNFIGNQMGVFKSQSIISRWLESKMPYQDSLSLHFSKTYVATDYSIDYSGYETLKSFGLKRIENDSLRSSISNLFEIQYPTFIKFTEIYQNFLDQLLAENPAHFNELNYMAPTMVPVAPAKLKEDSTYAYHLNTLKNFNQLLLYHGSVLKQKMQDIYSSIEQSNINARN